MNKMGYIYKWKFVIIAHSSGRLIAAILARKKNAQSFILTIDNRNRM